MIIVLTICSSNYLAHAKTLGESIVEKHPTYKFVIGLVDRIPQDLAPSYWHPFELIPIEDLGLPDLDKMAERYDIVELNTAVKPFLIEHLYKRTSDVRAVIYLDPDILVVGSLEPLVSRVLEHSLVLTPHSCTYDHSPEAIYYERAMLRTGVYNLGFLGTSRTAEMLQFLHWWQRRLVDYCFARFRDGLFVDQLWAVLALVYVRDVWIETGLGFNMCYWNLFERRLTHEEGAYRVNGREPLVFYHFSSYKPTAPDAILTRGEQPVPTFAERADLKPLFDEYHRRLMKNEYPRVSALKCYFVERKRSSSERRSRGAKTIARNVLTRVLLAIPVPVRRPLLRAAWFVISYGSVDGKQSTA